jgi:hypothetical protein
VKAPVEHNEVYGPTTSYKHVAPKAYVAGGHGGYKSFTGYAQDKKW